jgi:prepilin-type N-terminal cleavage/methylation domain-containing protein
VRRRLRLADEAGYSLIELLVVMSILGLILASLTQLFTSASTAQVDLTQRFRAQQEGRLALDSLRREIHCAYQVVPQIGVGFAPPTSGITISLKSYCPTSGGSDTTVTWCAALLGPQRYELRRVPTALALGATCAGGVQKADYLTTNQIFGPYATCAVTAGTRAKLGIDLSIDLNPTQSGRRYDLKDDIVLRNTARC